MHGLRQVYQDVNFIQLTAQGCRPILDWSSLHGCDRMVAFALREFVPANIDAIASVALVGRWSGEDASFARLRATLEQLRSVPRDKLFVFGDQPQLHGGLSTAVYWGRLEGLAEFLEHKRVKYEQGSNRRLRAMVDGYARFVEPHEYLCAATCPFFVDGDISDPMSRDGRHFTPNGSIEFARRLRAGGFEFI
jgi:hypothetical protein